LEYGKFLQSIVTEGLPNSYNIVKLTGFTVKYPFIYADLQVLVDYVMQPEPHGISLSQNDVQLQVYSLIDQNIRSVNVHLGGKSLGMVVRL
jgi:hypothetical protein